MWQEKTLRQQTKCSIVTLNINGETIFDEPIYLLVPTTILCIFSKKSILLWYIIGIIKIG